MKRALTASTVLHLVVAGGLALSLRPAPERNESAVAIDEVVVRAPHARAAGASRSTDHAPDPTPVAAPAATSIPVTAPSTTSDNGGQTVTVARDGAEQRLTVGEYERWVRARNRAPAYPRVSNQAREQGRVIVRVTIHGDGAADAAEVEVSSGFERLDQAALEAVRGWTFPSYESGAQGGLLLRFPFKFELFE